jgi:hypothetical protein
MGTSLRDFMRCTDLERIPEEILALYETEPVADEEALVFRPEIQSQELSVK